jgi:DNA-binding transcriptional ArsR family regulator
MLHWLRAAGEPSRLRLLALCAASTLTVSELARALTQSEARVSRHLKILCDAGLVQRLRRGQWVQYGATEEAGAASFVRGLLAHIDRRDPQLLRDAAATRAAAAAASPTGVGLTESRLGRALAAVAIGAGLTAPLDTVLLAGAAHPELLEAAARASRRCTALIDSRRAAQGARAFAAQRGFDCTVLQGSVGLAAGLPDLARAGSSLFEAVILDHPVASGEALAAVLASAAQILAPTGRLWIFEPYESLEGSRERIVEHPLARIRRLLGAVGLVCERLSPVEADGEHVLAAIARPASSAQQPQRPLQAGGIPR